MPPRLRNDKHAVLREHVDPDLECPCADVRHRRPIRWLSAQLHSAELKPSFTTRVVGKRTEIVER